MTTQEIADRLYELCEKGQFETAQNELYADNADSTEPDMQGNLETVKGLEAIKAKGAQFQSTIEEIYSGYTKEPKLFGINIFMEMGMDVKLKGMDRMNMNEMCHYVIKDGKIISEQFFW